MGDQEISILNTLLTIEDEDLRKAIERYLRGCWELFTEQPCSLTFHHTHTGGLRDHTIQVYEYGLGIIEALGLEVNTDHFIAAALLHDLGRIGYYVKDEEGNWYETLKHLHPEYPHSLGVVLDFQEKTGFPLPKEVEDAILSHMGGWSDTGVYPNTVLSSVLHAADLISSRVGR